MNASPHEVTQWLVDWSQGKKAALDKLMPLVFGELRRLADHYLRRERPDHTLQPTALVNEAYLRLVDQGAARWQDRAHFFGVAATIMRHILVDYARQHHRAKRGGGIKMVSLDEAADKLEVRTKDLVAIDDVLDELAALDPSQSRIIELRFFAGLSMEEIAEVLGLSLRTVHREWRTAKAWLRNRIGKDKPPNL